MKKRVADIVRWMIALILFGNYICIFFHGLYPNVCQEYRMYYLEDILTEWPGYGGLRYVPGEKRYFGLNDENRIKSKGIGWADADEDGCWTMGEISMLYLNIQDEMKLGTDMRIEMEIIQSLTTEVSVWINGTKIGIIKHEDNLFEADIHAKTLQDGFLEVMFMNENASEDNPFGLRLKSIELSWITK